jgi:ubiquinone/menaquinone biosynthesis C-methylase UbiE
LIEGGDLEERKLREIEHSRTRRKIVQGYERFSDTHGDEQAGEDVTNIKDQAAFEHHFSNTKFYSITVSSETYTQNWLRERCGGATALDYCCGNGEFALFMAKCGADAYGIDISPEGIVNAKENASQEGVSDQCHFEVMDAENMTFPDNTFDVIVEWGALHHLDYGRAMSELRRVLKPGGEIICIEALRHNPLFHLYRKMTMHLRTEWEVEHILSVKQLDEARDYFDCVESRYWHFFALAAVPLRKMKVFGAIRKLLDLCDRLFLSLPYVKRFAWIVVFRLSSPRK